MGKDPVIRSQAFSSPIDAGEMFFDNRITDEWLSTRKAASFLDISPNALRIKVHRGQIRAFKQGSRLKFRRGDLLASLRRREQ